jgi:hypothetical protein
MRHFRRNFDFLANFNNKSIFECVCEQTINPTLGVDGLPKARRKRTTLSGSYIIHYDCDPSSY